MIHVNFVMTTLLNGIWQGTLLAATMWLLLKLLPRLNPTTRFTVLWVTLIAVVALPLAPLASKNVRSASANGLACDCCDRQTCAHGCCTRYDSAAAVQPAGRDGEPRVESYIDSGTKGSIRICARIGIVASANAASPGASVVATVEHPVIRIHSGRFLATLEIVWTFLSIVMLVRLGFGFRKLQGLKADALPLPREWQLQLARLSRIHGVRRQTQLLVSARIAAPMSLGFLNPAILIPQTLLDTLSNAELEHVVLHELAHLRRRDDWTNLAQRLIAALLPIQPAS